VELPELQRRFGEMLRRHRRRVGLGQDKLAGQAGVHRTHLSLMERGKQMPSLAVIHKLSTALGVSMATMMAEVESDEPHDDPPPIRVGRPPKQEKTPVAKGRKGK
jgi:transcriptional regulator with XRE-family HTH domain